jgi:hypothetical protein
MTGNTAGGIDGLDNLAKAGFRKSIGGVAVIGPVVALQAIVCANVKASEFHAVFTETHQVG